MYSKSSCRTGNMMIAAKIALSFGVNITTNSYAGPLRLEKVTTPKHFSPIKQRQQFIIWGIVAMLCPIAGFLTYEYADWSMFYSVLISFSIELLVVIHISTHRVNDYIFKDEIENVQVACMVNRKILTVLFIVLFILNLYPLALIILGNIQISNFVNYIENCSLELNPMLEYHIWGWSPFDSFLDILTLFLIGIKLFINSIFIYALFRSGIFMQKIVVENYRPIRTRMINSSN